MSIYCINIMISHGINGWQRSLATPPMPRLQMVLKPKGVPDMLPSHLPVEIPGGPGRVVTSWSHQFCKRSAGENQ